jgi:hypothetical protein
MSRLLLLPALCLAASPLAAQDSIVTKTYEAVRVEKAPDIDGKLDDEVWQKGNAASDFIMNQPIEGSVPTQQTEFRIIYDNYAVYVGAIMYDNVPDSISRELGYRDDGLNADLFRFVIDPYNTRQDAYDFGVYASGVQIDSKFSDYTFDAVWESAVKIHDKGWTVEIRIPYSAIRFPKKEVQEWALQVTRGIVRKNEFNQWALTPSGKPNGLLYWGTMKGITNINAPLRLSFTPYLSAYYEKAPAYAADGSASYSNSFSYNAGADMKYGIDERFTVDLTLLPDFGQVQSDNKVKNLSYQEVTYDENREFFREGVDLFSLGGLFYSRRIGKVPSGFYSVPYLLDQGDVIEENPSQVKLLNALKLSGRTNNGLGLGLFNAVTDNTYAVIRDSVGNERKLLTEPLTNYNIIVFNQQLKGNSNVYFINTNVIRSKQHDDANVSKAGLALFNKKNTYAIDASGSVSQQLTLIDSVDHIYQDRLGYEYFIGARKTSGQVQFGASRMVQSNSYNKRDMGYFTPANYINHRGYFQYNIYKPNRFIRNSFNNISLDYGQNYMTKKRTNVGVNWNFFATLLNYIGVYTGGGVSPVSNYDYYEPRVPGRFAATSEYYYLYAGVNTDNRKKLSGEFTLNTANFFKNNKNSMLAQPGYGLDAVTRYRASNRLSFSYAFSYNTDPWNPGFVDIMDTSVIYGARHLDTYVNTITGKFIFKKDMALTLNARHYWSTGDYRQFYLLEANGDLTPINYYLTNNDFNYNAFNIDLVYSWQFAPGSTLSVVYKNAIEKDENQIIPVFMDNFRHTIESPQVNSFSVKLLYFLDYQYLVKKRNRKA